MKKFLSILSVSLLALFAIGAGCSSSAAFNVGDKVIAEWNGTDQFWDATITAVAGDQITISYALNNKVETVAKTTLAHIPSSPASVKVGDKVAAKYTDGRFWHGTVASLADSTAKINWTSGTPLDVPLKDITLLGK